MALVEFLKKYSKVNNNFIDDFYSLYDTVDKYKFCIDLEKVAEWLETRKDCLKNTLERSYEKNTEYTIQNDNENNNSHGGQNKELILISPKTFKKICIQSKTSKADEVREFYYQLEELVDRYKDYIIKGLNKKVKQLEHNQKTPH